MVAKNIIATILPPYAIKYIFINIYTVLYKIELGYWLNAGVSMLLRVFYYTYLYNKIYKPLNTELGL